MPHATTRFARPGPLGFGGAPLGKARATNSRLLRYADG
jgi:hypothetical protein